MAQKWFKYLFGESGDKTAVPDITDPSGYVSYQSGYSVDYERVLGTDPLAKAIERQKLNQVLYDITSSVQQYQINGFPSYIDATANGGTAYAYPIGAVVRFTDNKNYQNTVASNTNAPNISGWALYDNMAAVTHAATSKTTPVDADEIPIADSGDTFGLKKLTWANLKATFISAIGLQAKVATTLTGATTLTSAHLGSNVFCYSATPFTVTLPLLSSCPSGTRIEFMNFNSGLATISRQGTNQIYDGSLLSTTTLLSIGASVVFVSRGDYWFACSGNSNSIGYGQTWTDVKASRAASTLYTNNTSRPIQVSVSLSTSATSAIQVTVDGAIQIGGSSFGGAGGFNYASFIVPIGGTYSVVNSAGTSVVAVWSELR